MIKNKDTIFALGTPTGKSAIAVFRVSGKNIFKLAKKFFYNQNLVTKEHLLVMLSIKKDKKLTTQYQLFLKGRKAIQEKICLK